MSFYFLFWQHHVASGILVTQLGTETRPMAVKLSSPNHWTTTEFLSFKKKKTQNYNTLEEINKGILFNQKDFYSFQKGCLHLKSRLTLEPHQV